METPFGQLTYCSNIHAGEGWADHFEALKKFVPRVKAKVSPDKSFGIGLRLSNAASVDITRGNALHEFADWLKEAGCYVFTMNGFPYGGFHRTRVKDQVHAPDWTTQARVDYTKRLFDILGRLLPAGMEGGISTSPLTYRHWHKTEALPGVFETTTQHMAEVLVHLHSIHTSTGQVLHLDVEPEPDGLLESGPEFINWYNEYMLPIGTAALKRQFSLSDGQAAEAVRRHIQLCYDVCHFAVGYESHEEVVGALTKHGIKTGKIQISAALKAALKTGVQREAVVDAFKGFNESTYLHQVVARTKSGELKRYPDLPEALEDAGNPNVEEWRSHFHVPLFVEDYGVLQSTQQDIATVLRLQKQAAFTHHLEVETYTWEVLPEGLKVPIDESIVREISWVIGELRK